MRLVGRILAVVCCSCVPAVVMLIACGVDESSPPGITNEIPNDRISHPVNPASGGTTTGGGTPAQTICDVAAALAVNPVNACKSCVSAAITTTCLPQDTACMMDSACGMVTSCLAGCVGSTSATCVQDCVVPSATYQALGGCLLMACAQVCGQSTPEACDLSGGMMDGGADG